MVQLCVVLQPDRPTEIGLNKSVTHVRSYGEKEPMKYIKFNVFKNEKILVEFFFYLQKYAQELSFKVLQLT